MPLLENKTKTITRVVVLCSLLLFFVLCNYLIDKRNDKVYGDYNGNESEYVRTIDCAPFFDGSKANEFMLSFDLRTDIAGPVDITFYDETGTRYWLKNIKIDGTTEFQHYELLIAPQLSHEEASSATLIFHGGFRTGVIPHIKNIEITEKK